LSVEEENDGFNQRVEGTSILRLEALDEALDVVGLTTNVAEANQLGVADILHGERVALPTKVFAWSFADEWIGQETIDLKVGV
jgi:hypothetical protein